MARFSFSSTWLLAGVGIDQVYDALCDVESWPTWWRGALRVEPVDDDGETFRYTWRGRLPYRLHFTMRRVRQERPVLLEGRATGDLEGVGRWLLCECEDGVELTYDWTVWTRGPLLSLLAPVARGIFVDNHHWVMRNGATGLADLLGARLVRVGAGEGPARAIA